MKRIIIMTMSLLVVFSSLAACKRKEYTSDVNTNNQNAANTLSTENDNIDTNIQTEYESEYPEDDANKLTNEYITKEYEFNGLIFELPEDMYNSAVEKNNSGLILKPAGNESTADLFEIITNDKLDLFVDDAATSQYIYDNIDTTYSLFDKGYNIKMKTRDYEYTPDKQTYSVTFTYNIDNMIFAVASDIIATSERTVLYMSLSSNNNMTASVDGLEYLHSLEK